MPQPVTTKKRGPYRKSHIVRHGNGWKYHRTIPRDLHAALKNRKTWIKYLGKDRTSATIAAHVEDAKNETLIQRWRALTESERALIVSNGGIDAVMQNGGGDDPGLPFVRAVANLRLPSADDAVPPAGAPLDEYVSEDELERAVGTIVQAREYVASAAAKKESGRKIAAKLADGDTEGGAKLLALVDLWEKVRRPRSYKAAQKTRLFMMRFIDIVGDVEPRQLTRAHVIKFRDTLEEQKKSASNVTQHLDKIHAIFNTALSEGEMDINPAYRVKARKDTRKLSDRKQDFSSQQLRTILEKAKSERPDYGWVIRLLAYHGARSGEICQLRCDDVTTLHGVSVLRIHDRHGRVKNAASVRDIPIHPKCKGIIKWAERVAKERGADAWLFPDLPDHKQSRAHGFQNYVSRVFLRGTCGITGREHTLHSLRHSWRSMAREVNMPEPISRAIMGHSMGSDDHGAYGGVPSLQQRADWIARIDPSKG